MVKATLPSEDAVRVLVYEWYRKLDGHAPLSEYLALLADDCRMVFPEATLTGKDSFAAWYQGGANNFPGVINLFFDEKHEVKRVDVKLVDNEPSNWQADVLIVVKWEARRWTPPRANSDYLGFDAWQRWTVRLSSDGKPVVRDYIVDRLEKLQGSADL
jgi:hypothetical protein